jgi:hypothetical protein
VVDVSLGSLSGSRILSIVTDITPDTWAAAVAPASENVTGTQKVFINATVGVPAASLASTRGSLVVRASFQAVPGAPSTEVNCSDQASIAVAQYYGVDADALTPRLELVAGRDGVRATVLVHNSGNGADTFVVELENKPDVDPLGILTDLPKQILVQPETETNLSFEINATSLAQANTYELFVLVRSLAQSQTARDVVKVDAVVTRADIIPATDPSSLVLLVVVVVAVVGAAWGLRVRGRRKAARAARRQLARIVRAKKMEVEQPPPPPDPGADEPPTRVRVKTPPKPSK